MDSRADGSLGRARRHGIGGALAAPLAVVVAAGLAWVALQAEPWAQAPPGPRADGVVPLSEAERASFWGTAEDPPPEVLDATRPDLEGRHYLYSDELNLDLFQPHLQDLGGGYVGVGSDQAYLFAGWMRPSLMWLTDYDPWIKALHLAYFAFFEQAETIDEFMSLWNHNNKRSSRALLEERYAEHPERALILEVHNEATRPVHRRLRYLVSRMTELGLPSFVTDAETYAYVRALVLSGRVRPMVGNLLDEHGLIGASEAARELGVPIRAIYLSNAEQYWDYTEQFRANMEALHVDERSLVLRSRATKPQNGDYCYSVQPAHVFTEALRQSRVRRVGHVWRWCRIADPEDVPFMVLDELPAER
jgi:hypothetical protein